MRFELYDLGRDRKTFTFETSDHADDDDIARAMRVAVRKSNALMSRDITCTWDDEKKTGAVYAGWRNVGAARVVLP